MYIHVSSLLKIPSSEYCKYSSLIDLIKSLEVSKYQDCAFPTNVSFFIL